MAQQVETIIIGGGQAGLATSYHLTQSGCENIVFEKASQAGNAWRNDRWDSFTLVTPNWSFRLPGADYLRHDPAGFMPRGEIVAAFEQYVARFHLPVQYGVEATAVQSKTDGQGFQVKTGQTAWEAQNVVVAAGLYQAPKIQAFKTDLSPTINHVHSGHYRNPHSLPPGAVLVVGSAQSGCQIADELYRSGRKVYLCISSAGRAPRRYRGKDIYEWMLLSGFLDKTVDKMPSPKARFGSNPHLSGRDGGRSLNLHQFARDGVVLLGRIQSGRDNTIWLASDKNESLAKADQFETDLLKMADNYIAQAGLDNPPESLPVLRDGFEAEEITELDLKAAGITTIIWAMGYRFNFDLVKFPVFDNDGFPVQTRGVTAYPGLYFVGLPWLYKQKSGHLVGVAEDADFLAGKISGKSD